MLIREEIKFVGLAISRKKFIKYKILKSSQLWKGRPKIDLKIFLGLAICLTDAV